MLRRDKVLLENLTKKYGRKELVNEMSVNNFTKEQQLFYDLMDLRNEFSENYYSLLKRMDYHEQAECVLECLDEIISGIKNDYKFRG